MNEKNEESLIKDLVPETKETEKAEYEVHDELHMNKNEVKEAQRKEEVKAEKIKIFANVEKWFSKHGWRENPFTFNILPSLLVGYEEQTEELLTAINEKHKICLVIGPTGSGKTTMLKWIAENMPTGFESLYISKPPKKAEEFVDIFNDKFKRRILRFIPNIKNLYQIPEFLNRKTKNHLVFLCDEAHETGADVLEWLRVLGDQVENMTIILSALPSFDKFLKENLETFSKRITARIELISLTKEETIDLIRKRIEYVGGSGTEPFTDDALNFIYEQTGGFPREVIRLANDMMNKAIRENADKITPDLVKVAKKIEERIPEKLSLDIMENMTPLQERIIELIRTKPMSPGQIADTFDLSKYKSRQHAVRSVNNILIRLMNDGFVKRTRKGRTYLYEISPKFKTIVVKR